MSSRCSFMATENENPTDLQQRLAYITLPVAQIALLRPVISFRTKAPRHRRVPRDPGLNGTLAIRAPSAPRPACATRYHSFSSQQYLHYGA